MKDYGGKSRRELFEQLDAPYLSRLPTRRFEHATWKKAKVNVDYHIEVAKHYYSVPYRFAREVVEARVTASSVEVFHRGQRIASHRRNDRPGTHSTHPEHMPKSHRKHLEWTPSRMLNWAEKIGPERRALVYAILKSRPHPEMGYRSVLGLMRLAKRYDPERLEVACSRAMRVGARSYTHRAGHGRGTPTARIARAIHSRSYMLIPQLFVPSKESTSPARSTTITTVAESGKIGAE